MIATPDEVLAQMRAGIETPSGDISHLNELMTLTGKRVWQWLAAQPWLKDRLESKILERKEEGNRYEIIELCHSADGTEKTALIFFSENGQWRFHDVFLFEMRGAVFNLHLSYILNEPIKTRLKLSLQNPQWISPPPPWIWDLLNKMIEKL